MRAFLLHIGRPVGDTTIWTTHPRLDQPAYNGRQALKAMRYFHAYGVEAHHLVATTEANGILEILNLREMEELFDEKWTPT